MSEQMSTPRITAAYLDSFVGRVVTIVGKVTQLRGDQATIDADGVVTILLNRDAHLANGNAAQVIGKVNPDLSIKALSTRDVGAGVGHGVSPLRNHEPQHQPRIAMVWPAPNQIPVVDPNVVVPSSLEPSRRLSIGRLHRIASPLPLRVSSNSPPSSSQKDWQHQRQQQWLDLIPYESPPPPEHLPASLLYESSQESSSSSSSLPSTAVPPGFTPMPGSYYSDLDSASPSSEEEDMFRLAHSTSPPSARSTNPRSTYISPSSSQELQVYPFSLIPSAQPRSSFPSSSSPPPFTNMPYSTQAVSSLPSPPNSQHERPESPLSVADSQPTLRQGVPQVFSPSMSPLPRPQNRVSGRYAAQNSEDVDNQALNAVVDGIGRMQVSMNLDQAGRWRIARRTGAPW
ncbi:hypothetical protein ACHAQJ_000726 [Trichoderma viride]